MRGRGRVRGGVRLAGAGEGLREGGLPDALSSSVCSLLLRSPTCDMVGLSIPQGFLSPVSIAGFLSLALILTAP